MAAETKLKGRAVGVDNNLGDCVARVDFKWSATGLDALGVASGLFVRVVDNKNFLAILAIPNAESSLVGVMALLVVGGSLEKKAFAYVRYDPTVWSTITAAVAGSQFQVGVGRQDNPLPVLSGGFPKLATTLATGDVYLYDENAGAKAVTREYDNLAAWPMTPEAASFAQRSIEFRSDGVYRQHKTDDVWGRLVPEDGFNFKAPPGGLESRTARGIIIPSQGDLDGLPDTGTNKLSEQAFYRPGYLFAREAL